MNWFFDTFGFVESDNYLVNQRQMLNLYINGHHKSINNIDVGSFETINRSQIPIYQHCVNGGKVTLSHLISDVLQLHKDPLNHHATFQIASQSNCLEMSNPSRTPEDGLSIYLYDNTQGPLSAMATPAGLAYRQYLLPFDHGMGQTVDRQLDMSLRARYYVRDMTGGLGKFSNGYLFYTNEELELINQKLYGDQHINTRRQIRELIEVGSHYNLGVFINGHKYVNVNHVYCSGLPIAYNPNANVIAWKGMSEIFLEAIYENTLLNFQNPQIRQHLRLGLCCLNTVLREQKIFCSRTCIRRNFTVPIAQEKATQNLHDLIKMIEWNHLNQIACFRISSDIFPHFTDNDVPHYTIDFAKPLLKKAGDLANSYGQRILMHPGQFNQVGACNPDVFAKTVADLQHHANILDGMGIDDNGIITVHGGGTYGSKQQTMTRWIEQFKTLSQSIRHRLVIEIAKRITQLKIV